MQLDLFGFPLEEKPVKKQEKKAAVEKTPAKQEDVPAVKPVTEEYTEVNIHAIPGLRQITILDAVAVVNPPAATVILPAPPEIEPPVAEVTTPGPVIAEEPQVAENILAEIKEEAPITKDEPFIAELQPADEIPVTVLEAMAEEAAILERLLEEQENITEEAKATAEEPVTAEAEIEAATPVETHLAEQEATNDDTPTTEEAIVLANVLEEPFTEEPVEDQQVIETVEELPASAIEEPPIEDTPAEKSPALAIMPVPMEHEPEPAGEAEEPELVIYAAKGDTDDENVIDFNQTLFSRQSVEEMVSPAKKAALTAKGKRGRKSYKDIDAEIALVEVPDDEELFQKLYYPISQVAQWFNVNTSLLRFWENEFDILKPRKNRKGDRLFRPEDVKNLQVIYHLLRQRKFSIEGAKKYIKQNKSRAEVNIQLIQSLTKFRSFLLEMKANLGA